jgi:succinate dehydrogenase / fumarate reductase flavoprotein subunit
MWDNVGMARTADGLRGAISSIRALKEEFWNEVRIPGEASHLNPSLERAGRVADFMEFGELMAVDALAREESCGGHFREEHQSPDGEAARDDDNFSHASAWEHKGPDQAQELHKEQLTFDYVQPSTRSYK